MKAVFSTLAEEQTIRTIRVNDRVSIRIRQCVDGVVTRDVMVDGYCYTPAISEEWITRNLPVILELIGKREHQTHIGMGQFIHG